MTKIIVVRDPTDSTTDIDVTGCFEIDIGERPNRFRINVNQKSGTITINGDGPLAIHPEVSNQVRIAVIPR